MNLSELFIKRPIATTLIMMGILIFGIMGYRLLPVSDLPNVDFPTIQVSASLPGASPETMASSVATPLEKQFSTIAGLDSMNSVSSQGSSQITLQFNLNRDIDAAAQDVQAAIAKTQRQLPSDMPSPPSYRKVDPSAAPIILLTLTAPQMSLYQLDEYAENLMAQRISMVNGVAQVSVYGSQKYAVRVQMDPLVLANKGISFKEVATAINNHNVNMPSGTLNSPDKAITLEANGQLMKAEDYRPLIVAYRNGSPVRLEQVSNVIDSVENDKSAAWLVDQRAIILAVQKQPGTNTVEVVKSIKELMPAFQSQLPASVNLQVLYDRSEPISSSVEDVKFTLLLTVCLVVLVIFLFLKNLSATIIPSLALPMSICGTFAVMYALNYNLDNLSLMALTLSVGFVVDDAIVMLENIVRHMEHGETPYQAALNGSKEIGFTILSMTLSLAAVFIPVLFMGGIIGRLFQEFAVTIGAAILVSGFVSLTLTPMLCSRFLKPIETANHGKLYNLFENGFKFIAKIYERTLKVVLRHRLTTLLFSFVLLGLTAYLFVVIPKGFIPSQDIGQISGGTEAAQGISFTEMQAHQQKVADVLKKDPNVDAFMSSIGSSNTGNISIRLKPKGIRKLTPEGVIEELRPKLDKIPGIRVYLQNPPAINLGGRSSNSLYQITLQSPDTNSLYKYAGMMENKMKNMAEIQDVNSNLQIKSPQLTIDIDRDKAAALGVNTRDIEDTLYYYYGTRQISTIYAPNNDYAVVMELKPEFQKDQNALSSLYVKSDNGNLVPLYAVARVRPDAGPLSINHTGQLPSVTISFNLKTGVSLSQALDAVNKVAEETLPATINTNFQGTAQAFQSSMKGMGWLLLMAVLVIYMILGILYESFVHPVTILSGLPSAALGALLTLLVFKVDLNIYAFVGIIMLVGLVKKNAIMMIDFALDAQRSEGKDPESSIFQGCMVRFRPIMMTTMAALMGTLPIALGFGAGAEARRPLGLAVVGGLLVSQLLTLYLTPVYFIYLDKLRLKFSPKKKHN
jgi:HAE1 family hydrophobic/amphiphilic exporter-1